MEACFRAIDGGLDLAVEAVTGARPAWFVEFDAAPSKILAHHWPEVPNYGDVTQVDWSTVPPVDILTGGYPCQPFSAAGRRKGTNDERHLWPYARDAIRHLRPRFALLENVAGHRSLGLDTVLADLAKDGAHVWWTSLRASDGGAPHHRERLFILVAPDPSRIRPGELLEPFIAGVPPAAGGSRPDTPADAGGFGWGPGAEQPGAGSPEVPAPVSSEPPATTDFGPYTEAVQRWEHLTRPAPAPTELNRNNKPRLNPAFAEWMMGLPPGHVTAVPGVSRAEQLKAIGNGVCVPQGIAALVELLDLAHHQELSTYQPPPGRTAPRP